MATKVQEAAVAILRTLNDLTKGNPNSVVDRPEFMREQGLAPEDFDRAIRLLDYEGYVTDRPDTLSITVPGSIHADQLSQSGRQEEEPVSVSIQVFVSHVAEDQGLAEGLVTCLEGSLAVPPSGGIRCTSVTGYKLMPGDEASTQLRSDLHEAKVVIGLLTPQSLRSGWVLMELGAAWAFEKRTCPVLSGGVDVDSIPGPLGGRHGVRLGSATDLAALVEIVERETGWAPRPADRRQRAITEMASLASIQDEVSPVLAPVVVRLTTDEDDAIIALRGWIKNNWETMQGGVSLSGLDAELRLAPGLASKLMKAAANAEGWDEKQRGSDRALYEERAAAIEGDFGFGRPGGEG